MKILDTIGSPLDVNQFSLPQLEQLASEIREDEMRSEGQEWNVPLYPALP